MSVARHPAHLLLPPRWPRGGTGRLWPGHKGQAFWLYLAMAAAVLMAVAPVVSWTLQALHAGHATATRVSLPDPAQEHDGHGNVRDAHPHQQSQVHGTAPATSSTAATNPHASHGAACDYCLIAARLLPAVFCLLLALLWFGQPAVPVPPRTGSPVPARWPAHGARGPPLLA